MVDSGCQLEQILIGSQKKPGLPSAPMHGQLPTQHAPLFAYVNAGIVAMKQQMKRSPDFKANHKRVGQTTVRGAQP